MYDERSRMAFVTKALSALIASIHPESRTGTIAEAASEYLAAKTGLHKPKTEANREYYMARFVADLGEIPLAELTEDDTTLWLDHLPPGSRHNVRTVITPFLNWASTNGWPFASSAKPRVIRKGARERDRYLTADEYSRVMSYLAVYVNQPRSRAVTVDALWLCLTTPMRSGEVVTLTRNEVSPMGDYVFLRDAKTGDRKVWLGPQAQVILRRRRNMAKSAGAYLFPGRTHAHLWQSSLSQRWREIAKSLDLSDVCLHDLRHTWASRALQSGERMEKIRVALGHSTKHMTARYAHLGDEHMLEVATRVERLLLSSSELQLSLALPETPELCLDELSDAQQALVMCPGSEILTRGAGQAQAAKALVRQGVLVEVRKGAYRRTNTGERLRDSRGGER